MTRIIRPRDELAEHFNACAYWLLDLRCEFGMELTAQQEKALEIFETLRDTVDGIPLPVLQITEEFMIADPGQYDNIAASVARSVGYSFLPRDAHAFVVTLNAQLQLSARHFA